MGALATPRHRIEICWRLRVAKVSTGNPTLLADLAEDCPGLPGSTTVATVLVRLTELTALVLTMR